MKLLVLVVILAASFVWRAAPRSLLPGKTHFFATDCMCFSQMRWTITYQRQRETFTSLIASLHLHCQGHMKATSVVAATSILRTHSQCRHAVLLLTDGDKVCHHSCFFFKLLQSMNGDNIIRIFSLPPSPVESGCSAGAARCCHLPGGG